MLLADGALGLILFGLWVFCIIDVIVTDSALCRNLPKLVWLFLVLILMDIGSIAWLVAGRPWASHQPPTRTSRFPEYDRPGRHIPASPDDDEEFLRGLRERADQQRREYRDRRDREQLAEQERLRLERERWEQRDPDAG